MVLCVLVAVQICKRGLFYKVVHRVVLVVWLSSLILLGSRRESFIYLFSVIIARKLIFDFSFPSVIFRHL